MSKHFKKFASHKLKNHHSKGKGTWLGRQIKKSVRLAAIILISVNLAGLADSHIAGNKVKNMTAQEITHLSYEDSAELLSRMSSTGNIYAPWVNETTFWPLTLSKMLMVGGYPKFQAAKLQRATGIDPKFRDYYAVNRTALDKYLANAPIMKIAHKGWAKADNETRFKWLTEIANAHSKIMGFEKPEMRMVKEDSRAGEGVYAFFDPLTEKVTLLANAAQGWDNFDTIVPILIHENTHSHQNQLEIKLLRGEIKKSDPRYGQASVFLASTSSSARNAGAYHSNPAERHAYWAMSHIMKHFPEFPEDLKILLFGQSYGIERRVDKKTLSAKDRAKLVEFHSKKHSKKKTSKIPTAPEQHGIFDFKHH